MVEGWRSSCSSITLSAFPMLTKMLSGLTPVMPKFRSMGQGLRYRNHLCGLYRTLDACNRLEELELWQARPEWVTNAKCGPRLHWSLKKGGE